MNWSKVPRWLYWLAYVTQQCVRCGRPRWWHWLFNFQPRLMIWCGGWFFGMDLKDWRRRYSHRYISGVSYSLKVVGLKISVRFPTWELWGGVYRDGCDGALCIGLLPFLPMRFRKVIKTDV